MEKLSDKTFKRWKSLAERIKDDLHNILFYQRVYCYFEEMIKLNENHINANSGGTFCLFVWRCYAVYAMVGIRRHCMLKDDISLIKLLDLLRKSSNQFSYEYYLTQHPIHADEFEWQRMTFENFSDDGKILSEKRIIDDINELKKISKKVTDFVNKEITHLDKKGATNGITNYNLIESIDLLNKLACKYITLILGNGYSTLEPTPQFEWKSIFNVPFDIRGLDGSEDDPPPINGGAFKG